MVQRVLYPFPLPYRPKTWWLILKLISFYWFLLLLWVYLPLPQSSLPFNCLPNQPNKWLTVFLFFCCLLPFKSVWTRSKWWYGLCWMRHSSKWRQWIYFFLLLPSSSRWIYRYQQNVWTYLRHKFQVFYAIWFYVLLWVVYRLVWVNPALFHYKFPSLKHWPHTPYVCPNSSQFL